MALEADSSVDDDTSVVVGSLDADVKSEEDEAVDDETTKFSSATGATDEDDWSTNTLLEVESVEVLYSPVVEDGTLMMGVVPSIVERRDDVIESEDVNESGDVVGSVERIVDSAATLLDSSGSALEVADRSVKVEETEVPSSIDMDSLSYLL